MGKLFVTLFAFNTAYNTAFNTLRNPDTLLCPQFNSYTVINYCLRDSLYPMTLPSVGQGLRRDTAPVPSTKFVTGDNFVAPIKLVPRSRQHAIKFVPWRQKARHTLLAPWQFSGPASARYQDAARCLRRVTLTKTYRRAVISYAN